MTETSIDKKEATPFAVATARMPQWLFDIVETFKENNEFKTRSDAVNILILLGLRQMGMVPVEKYNSYLDALVTIQMPDAYILVINKIKKVD